MDLAETIRLAVRGGRFLVSRHARGRLRQRGIQLWQLKASIDQWSVMEVRPQDLPNPSIVAEQNLPDGSEIIVVWAWNANDDEALLVTVYFPT